MDICSENNIVFIYIGGVSSSDEDYTKLYNNSPKKYIFESVSYNSSKSPDYVINDILTGRKDSLNLDQHRQITPDTARKAKRLNRLVSIISFYMRYTTKKIVVIGVSHGSLIVHSAILKIKAIYTPTNNLIDIFSNRIIVLTLGSPKYLPKTLLNSSSISDEMSMEYGNVYNFYNIKDKIYSILGKIRNLGINNLSYLSFPKLSEINSDNYIAINDIDKIVINCSKPELYPKYKFDKIEHIFYVQNTEYLKFTKGYITEYTLIYDLCNNMSSIIFFHSVLFNLFPILLDNLHIIHYMRNIKSLDVLRSDESGNLALYDRNELLTFIFIPPITFGGIKIKKIKKLKKYLNSK